MCRCPAEPPSITVTPRQCSALIVTLRMSCLADEAASICRLAHNEYGCRQCTVTMLFDVRHHGGRSCMAYITG